MYTVNKLCSQSVHDDSYTKGLSTCGTDFWIYFLAITKCSAGEAPDEKLKINELGPDL